MPDKRANRTFEVLVLDLPGYATNRELVRGQVGKLVIR
jgi:hypothetical protein